MPARSSATSWFGGDPLVNYQTPGTKRFVVALYAS